MSKILCPRCGKGLARRMYIQDTGPGRPWVRLDEFLWCPTERAVLRVADKRRLIA